VTSYLQEDLAEAHKLLWRALNSRTRDEMVAEVIQAMEVLDLALAQTVLSERYSSDSQRESQ
jgi:hypothetical protein